MSTALPRARFTDAILAWLNARFAPPGVTIAADTPLFAGRLIDSIRILELIAWTDRVIPDTMIRMDHFHTVDTIARTFIDEDRHAAA
jgi:hypothetical protein